MSDDRNFPNGWLDEDISSEELEGIHQGLREFSEGKTRPLSKILSEFGGTMSEQRVLPEFIATLKVAAEKAEIGEWQVVRGKGGEGWTICSLGDDRDGNPVSIETMGVRGSQLRCSIINDAEFFVAASPENILKLLASLAQSEAERERLQEEVESMNCGISWNGFNIKGDQKSIKEVQAALHSKDSEPDRIRNYRELAARCGSLLAEREKAATELAKLREELATLKEDDGSEMFAEGESF